MPDAQGRKRTTRVKFRVSDEERELINYVAKVGPWPTQADMLRSLVIDAAYKHVEAAPTHGRWTDPHLVELVGAVIFQK